MIAPVQPHQRQHRISDIPDRRYAVLRNLGRVDDRVADPKLPLVRTVMTEWTGSQCTSAPAKSERHCPYKGAAVDFDSIS